MATQFKFAFFYSDHQVIVRPNRICDPISAFLIWGAVFVIDTYDPSITLSLAYVLTFDLETYSQYKSRFKTYKSVTYINMIMLY